jgi:heat shock protein HtpX
MSIADPIDHFARRRHKALNTLHTWLLAGGSLLILGVSAWAYGDWAGVAWALVFGAFSFWMARRASPQMVLKMYKAEAVGEADFPVGVQILRELSNRAGLPEMPQLYVVPSQMLNAFAVGRREDSAIAITDALARRLSARELAGVLAHEVSHIANDDLKVMAFADVVARFTSIMSTLGMLSLVLNIGSYFGGAREAVPWLAVLVLLVSPTIGGLLQLALSRTREFDADLGAAILTGDPDGLASALTKLEKAQGKLWEGLMLPGSRVPHPSVLRSHPRTADRVARLMALKAGGQEAAREPAKGEGISGTVQPAPRPCPQRRPSLVPRVAYRPGVSGMPFALVDADLIDDSQPAAPESLNPPEGRPRMHFVRGGVWW